MYSPKLWCVLLSLFCIAPGPLAFAQSANSGSDPAPPAAKSKAKTDEEVRQLRREVEELRAQLQQLVNAQNKPAAAPPPVVAPPPAATPAQVAALQSEITDLQKKASQTPPATAGWNGEHFFLRSSDGAFTLMPVGYVDGQYAVYGNTYGAPPDSFAITRARFGFQGNYGSQLDYSMMIETISSPTVRDAYLDFKPSKALSFMGGQFKVPFSMEVGTGDTAVDFYNRSIISVLYPDAAGGNRAPGIDVHGDLGHGIVQYWLGLFNGQGILASGTTNEPEVVGRVAFSPWKGSQIGWLENFTFGGSAEHSRSRGLTNELSFSGAMNDGTYTFFPQFRINGNVNRYNAFLSWLDGPLGIRAEYAHLQQDRADIGSIATGGIGFNTLPSITGEGYYVSAIYFLTGETDPLECAAARAAPGHRPGFPRRIGVPGLGRLGAQVPLLEPQGQRAGRNLRPATRSPRVRSRR
jgi:hypothetical protein